MFDLYYCKVEFYFGFRGGSSRGCARILFRENFRHVKGFGKIKRIILEVVSLQFFTADFFAPFLHQPLSQLHDYKVLINLSV